MRVPDDLYRGRAEKAGITYIDIFGPVRHRLQGQRFRDKTTWVPILKARGGDYGQATARRSTRAGAQADSRGVLRKTHEDQPDVDVASGAPVATPLPQLPEPEPPRVAADHRRAGASAAACRLHPSGVTLTTPKGAGDALLGATPVRNTTADSATCSSARPRERRATGEPRRVEPTTSPGRITTWSAATSVLTAADPVEPPEAQRCGGERAGASAPAAAAVASAPKQGAPAPAPREARRTTGPAGRQECGLAPAGRSLKVHSHNRGGTAASAAGSAADAGRLFV